MKEYYEILWVDENASMDEIKKAYRNLSMKNHPDVWWSTYLFKQINSAYSFLKENHWKWYTENVWAEGSSKTEEKKQPTNEKQFSSKHPSLQYLLEHKTTSIVKTVFIILLFISALDENSDPMIRDFICISSVNLIILYIHYNKKISSYLWFNIWKWVLTYLIIVFPILGIVYIEEFLWLPPISLLWLITILIPIYFFKESFKDKSNFKGLKPGIYFLVILQIITYTGLL